MYSRGLSYLYITRDQQDNSFVFLPVITFRQFHLFCIMGTIRQKHFIRASAEDIYHALVNPFAIELWSGYPANMSEEEGSGFEIWEGDIAGKNLRFEKNSLIVQEWYFGEQPEPSIVTIRLQEGKKGTTLQLEHTNIPESEMEEMEKGWSRYYFGALKHYFED